MRKIFLPLAAMAGLAACATQVPDSGAGVGFNDYDNYTAAREAELRGQRAAALPPAQAVSGEVLEPASGPVAQGAASDDPSAIAAETQAALNASARNSGVAPVQASPGNPAPEAVNTFGISRENDFSAVDDRRSIEADAQRLEQVRAQYEQVQPQALPARTSTGPNIVAYALETTNQPGQKLYSRSGIAAQSRFERNCAKYPSPDLAQADFLRSGGPQRDRKGLDPDGDGFACSWDPRPFRTARGG